MDEPENHTLRLLRELRSQGENLEKRMERGFAEMRERFEAIDERFERVDERFERVDERFNGIDSRLETITRALANEIIQGKFVTAARYVRRLLYTRVAGNTDQRPEM